MRIYHFQASINTHSLVESRQYLLQFAYFLSFASPFLSSNGIVLHIVTTLKIPIKFTVRLSCSIRPLIEFVEYLSLAAFALILIFLDNIQVDKYWVNALNRIVSISVFLCR